MLSKYVFMNCNFESLESVFNFWENVFLGKNLKKYSSCKLLLSFSQDCKLLKGDISPIFDQHKRLKTSTRKTIGTWFSPKTKYSLLQQLNSSRFSCICIEIKCHTTFSVKKEQFSVKFIGHKMTRISSMKLPLTDTIVSIE